MTDGMQSALARIRERFLTLLDERRAAIQGDLEIAFASPEQSALALGRIGAELHKISGTAGTLGFAELGDRARLIENKILNLSDDHDDTHNEICMDVVDFLEHAKNNSAAAA